MASIDDAIFARLAASTAVTGISSTASYNLQAAQGCQTPYNVYNVLSHRVVDSFDGVGRLMSARLQIDSYGSDKDAATRLAVKSASTDCLGGFSGFSAGIRVTRCLGPRTGFGTYEVETHLYREMREFSLGYYETTA